MPAEHYAAIFGRSHLLLALTLRESLVLSGQPFRLWCLCTDDETVVALLRLRYPDLVVVTVGQLKDARSLEALALRRTREEFHWTLKAFFLTHILAQPEGPEQVSYVDADLYFFARPSLLFESFQRQGASLLLTEHSYFQRYQFKLPIYGRYCAQFVTVRNTPTGLAALSWWQQRCLEACPAVPDGRLCGDQKYLEEWPRLFGSEVCVLEDPQLAAGPWNIENGPPDLVPVFYHFQGLRFLTRHVVLAWAHWKLGRAGTGLYRTYLAALRRQQLLLQRKGIEPELPWARPEPWPIHMKRWLTGWASFHWF